MTTRRDPDDRAPPPSARVRLEVELLASDQPAPMPAPALGDHQRRHTVLVVAGDADVRRYVGECLRDRTDLRVLEAAAIGMAKRLAALQPPKLLIVDAPDASVLDAIGDVRAVLIADDGPAGGYAERESHHAGAAVRSARPSGARRSAGVIISWQCCGLLGPKRVDRRELSRQRACDAHNRESLRFEVGDQQVAPVTR